jgi:hypothetical protein
MVDDLGIAILFHESGHVLDRTPSGDVAVLALAEYAVQQAGGTQQTHVAAMEGRNRDGR